MRCYKRGFIFFEKIDNKRWNKRTYKRKNMCKNSQDSFIAGGSIWWCFFFTKKRTTLLIVHKNILLNIIKISIKKCVISNLYPGFFINLHLLHRPEHPLKKLQQFLHGKNIIQYQ